MKAKLTLIKNYNLIGIFSFSSHELEHIKKPENGVTEVDLNICNITFMDFHESPLLKTRWVRTKRAF